MLHSSVSIERWQSPPPLTPKEFKSGPISDLPFPTKLLEKPCVNTPDHNIHLPCLQTCTRVPETALFTSIPDYRRRVHTLDEDEEGRDVQCPTGESAPGSEVIAVADFEPQRERSNMALVSDREAEGV
ncbi:unnamed protein product [Arctogadus glacialis]